MSTFDDPASGGDALPLADLLGATLVIQAHEAITDLVTSFGVTNPVRATVTVIDGTHAGQVYTDTLIFPKVLASALRSKVGGAPVAGKLGKGNAKPGQSAPWILEPLTDAEKKKAAAAYAKISAPAVDGF